MKFNELKPYQLFNYKNLNFIAIPSGDCEDCYFISKTCPECRPSQMKCKVHLKYILTNNGNDRS